MYENGRNGKSMRYGFTTGSCAAAAAKAAAYMLLTGKEKTEITIETPKGIPYHTRIEDIRRSEAEVCCAVRKDGGDDPDITSGILIFSAVRLDKNWQTGMPQIKIMGGAGIGTVTKPGLDQPVGNAAINRVPREMIQKEVTEVCTLTDYKGGLLIEISAPEGERLADQTFNPRLGIAGGISILGTSGIVEPMSSQALIDTIRAELSLKKAEQKTAVAVSPGNYGQDFMKRAYGFDLESSVKCSNFIGITIDMAAEMGFENVLLTGHIGKLVKLSGGIMNTHSKEGDCRMELLAAAGIRAGCGTEVLQKIMDCVTTEEAIRVLKETGRCESVMEQLLEKILFYVRKRAGAQMQVECILYTNEYGELAKSSGAVALLERLKKQK